MFFDTNEDKDCSGCTACVNACPVSCIKMQENREHFLYPEKDLSTCIECGLCEKICPWEHPYYNNFEHPQVYAAALRDVAERKKSSSGGAFFAIASFVIEHHGVVFGATMSPDFQVFHKGVDNIDDLSLLRGSKYVQSKLDNVFKEIQDIVKTGRLCYFVGTGCQVAGLRAYLRKDYQSLITSDLVCHGVPNQYIFNCHIKYLREKYGGDIVDYQFRDNAGWGGCEKFIVVSKRGRKSTVVNPTYNLSPYLYSFMHSKTLRYSCYDCRFSKLPRQGDITLADYWGIQDIHPEVNTKFGVSMVSVNSERGSFVWDQIKDQCSYVVSDLNAACESNANLAHYTNLPKDRDGIYERLDTMGYRAMAITEFKHPDDKKIKWNIFIYENPIFVRLYQIYRQISTGLGLAQNDVENNI